MGRKVTIGAYQAGALSGFDALLNLEGFFDELGVIATDQIVYTSLLQAGDPNTCAKKSHGSEALE